VVDEAALVEALQQRTIRAAAALGPICWIRPLGLKWCSKKRHRTEH